MVFSKRERLKNIPKVELHRHLDGSIRFETLFSYGNSKGYFDHLKKNNQKTEQFKKELFKKVKVLGPMGSLQEVLDSFWLTQKIMDAESIIEQIAYENVEDCYLDGVKLAELRFAPVFIGLNKQTNKLGHALIIQAVCRGVERALKSLPIHVGLIYIIPRGLDFETNKEANKILLNLLAHDSLVSRLIVGADLADVEKWDDMPRFVPLINELREAGLKITIHSGEDTSSAFLEKSFDLYRPSRIGHGIRVIEDKWSVKRALELGIHFEVCPTSNYLTKCVDKISNHPIREMLKQGLSLSINSDDPHIMNIDLTHEYELLESDLKFTHEEFIQINRLAIDASFLPVKIKNATRSLYF